MEQNKIYLPLQGRIGNQLFQYAFARSIQKKMGVGAVLVMDDSEILRCGWENSLPYYNLPDVSYVHENLMEQNRFSRPWFLRKIYRGLTRNKDYRKKYEWEKRLSPFFQKRGMFLCENGYLPEHCNLTGPVYLDGFFQSHHYFEAMDAEVKDLLDGNQFAQLASYPNIDLLRNRNSVCISVKVEHNVGSSMYDVCTMQYWKEAIKYVTGQVKDPLFFICSDNVPYVLSHLIDANQFDYVEQSREFPVHVSLAAMAECKHFIIGNTTFGWWAQYLSRNPEKIVVAPSRWMAVDMPIDLYQDGWHLVEV